MQKSRTTSKKPDRRTLRTQTALRRAFMRLLHKRAYEKITVQEIIDEADVGRSTFYAHCSGKDQLLRLSLSFLREEMREAQAAVRKSGRAGLAFSLPLLEHVAEHRHLYPNVTRGRGAAIFMAELRGLVLDLVRRELGGKPDELTAQFVTGAFLAVLVWWVESRSKLSPQEVDRHFQALTDTGLRRRI